MSNSRCLDFVHISKTAGRSIELLVRRHLPGAGKGWFDTTSVEDKLKWHDPQKLFTCKNLFSVVRNPYSRMLSEFYCPIEGFRKCEFRKRVKKEFPITASTLNKWLQTKLKQVEKRGHWRAYHGHRQYDYVFDRSGRRRVNHVLHYETLEEDFNALMRTYNISVRFSGRQDKQSEPSHTVSTLDFTRRTIYLINKVYEQDFKHFGYTMLTGDEGSQNFEDLILPAGEVSDMSAEKSMQTASSLPRLQAPCSFDTLSGYIRCRMRSDGSLYAHFADRLWTKRWIRNEICGASVPKLIAYVPALDLSAARIFLDEFVAPSAGAVVKLNHMAGAVTALKGGSKLHSSTVEKYVKGLQSDYKLSNSEAHYRYVDKGIIIEELLPTVPGEQFPTDYKLMAFDGVIPMVQIFSKRKYDARNGGGEQQLHSGNHARQGQVIAFDPRLFNHTSRVNVQKMFFAQDFQGDYEKPCGWDNMMRIAECMSKGIDAVRIDLYLLNCQTYMGEITMTPFGGRKVFPEWQDKWLGSFISRRLPFEGLVHRHHQRKDIAVSSGGDQNSCRSSRKIEVPDATEEILLFQEPGLPEHLRGTSVLKCVWLISDDLNSAYVHDGIVTGHGKKLMVGKELFRKVPFVTMAPPFENKRARCASMRTRQECCNINFFRFRGVTVSGADPDTTPDGIKFMPVNVATLFFCEALRRLFSERRFESMVELGTGSGAGGSCAIHFGKDRGLKWVGLLDIDPMSARFINSPVFGMSLPDIAMSTVTADADTYSNTTVQMWVSNPPYIPTPGEMKSGQKLDKVAEYAGWAFGLRLLNTLLERKKRAEGAQAFLFSISSLSLRSPAFVDALERACEKATLEVVLDREAVLPVRLLSSMFSEAASEMIQFFETQKEGFSFGSTVVCGHKLPTGLSLLPSQCLESGIEASRPQSLHNSNHADMVVGKIIHPTFTKKSGHAYERIIFLLLRT